MHDFITPHLSAHLKQLMICTGCHGISFQIVLRAKLDPKILEEGIKVGEAIREYAPEITASILRQSPDAVTLEYVEDSKPCPRFLKPDGDDCNACQSH